MMRNVLNTIKPLSLIAVSFVVCLISTKLFAENESFTVESDLLSNESVMTQFNEKGINAWGLDQEELKQYQRVRQGNRQFWSPNLHPLAALGMREGVTASERNKLAEKLVHIERKRMQREIAFEKAFQAANRRYYSHIPLFQADPPRTKRPITKSGDDSASIDSKYINYYVPLPCPQCKKSIQKWLKENKHIDLYIDSSSNKAIRTFAKDMGISPLLVPSKVRLNKTSIAALQKAGITKLPHVEVRQ